VEEETLPGDGKGEGSKSPSGIPTFSEFAQGQEDGTALSVMADEYSTLLKNSLWTPFKNSPCGRASKSSKSSEVAPVMEAVKRLSTQIGELIRDVKELERIARDRPINPYFKSGLVERFNVLRGLLLYFIDAEAPTQEFSKMGQPEFLEYLLSHVRALLYLGENTPDLQKAPPTKQVAVFNLSGKKPLHHRGLPICTVALADLPPALVVVILQIRCSSEVQGADYEPSGARRTQPDEPGKLRSYYQNEMGLLPTLPESMHWERRRAAAYHVFWANDFALAGGQRDKGLARKETGIYEVNAAGISDKQIRLLYDYANDRFFITFHYQLVKVARQQTGGLEPLKATSKEEARPVLLQEQLSNEDAVNADELWTSGLFLVDIPDSAPCALELDYPPAAREPAGPPFPKMELALTKTGKEMRLQVTKSAWQQAMRGVGKPGTPEQGMLVYDLERRFFFDFHLTCQLDKTGEVVTSFHLAVRLKDVHGWVVYWWHSLLWLNPEGNPATARKGTTFEAPKVAWCFEGPVGGHAAAYLPSLWERLEPYGHLFDGAAVLEQILTNLLNEPRNKVTVVRPNKPGEPEPPTFYRLG
jgi:hypothetical protein